MKKGAADLIPLTVPEVRTLLLRLVWTQLAAVEQTLAWSEWRRRHQHRVRASHYKKRKTKAPSR